MEIVKKPKTTGLVYKELVYNGYDSHQFQGVILQVGQDSWNGRKIIIKDNDSDLIIEVILWDKFKSYMGRNDELKDYLDESRHYEEIFSIYDWIYGMATDNLYEGDIVRVNGTLYVSDERISHNWNLVTRNDYNFKEKEKIVIVTPYLYRVEQQDTSEDIEQNKEIQQSEETKFGKIKKWCLMPFRWFMNIVNSIQGFEWIQKIINWFSKGNGSQ